MPEETVGILTIIFTLGPLGFACCVTALWVIYKQPILHNAFGCLCAAHSIIEGLIIFCFVFIATPVILIWPLETHGILINILGSLSQLFHYSGNYFQFIKSINRCYAIIFSISYRKTFTIKVSLILIVLILCLSLLHSIPAIAIRCQIIYNTQFYSWLFAESRCNRTFWYYVNFSVTIGLLGLTLSCDGVTLIYLRKFNKKLVGSNQRISVKEKRFFFQACITSILYAAMQLFPYFLRTFSTTSWTLFLSSTMNWLLFHSLNELLFVFIALKISKKTKTSSMVSVFS